jgi:hypothetical protein
VDLFVAHTIIDCAAASAEKREKALMLDLLDIDRHPHRHDNDPCHPHASDVRLDLLLTELFDAIDPALGRLSSKQDVESLGASLKDCLSDCDLSMRAALEQVTETLLSFVDETRSLVKRLPGAVKWLQDRCCSRSPKPKEAAAATGSRSQATSTAARGGEAKQSEDGPRKKKPNKLVAHLRHLHPSRVMGSLRSVA